VEILEICVQFAVLFVVAHPVRRKRMSDVTRSKSSSVRLEPEGRQRPSRKRDSATESCVGAWVFRGGGFRWFWLPSPQFMPQAQTQENPPRQHFLQLVSAGFERVGVCIHAGKLRNLGVLGAVFKDFNSGCTQGSLNIDCGHFIPPGRPRFMDECKSA